MSADKNWQFELEEYIKQGEPGQIEKSEAWQTAIGLQAIDGLQTSAYLLDTAKEHIEGKISIDEVQKRIQSYYEQRADRSKSRHACSSLQQRRQHQKCKNYKIVGRESISIFAN